MKKKIVLIILALFLASGAFASSVQIHPPWGQDGNVLFVQAFGKDRYLIVKTRTSAAIQAAITALGTEGGTVFLPDGTYTVSTPITATCNSLVISGSGDETKLVLGADERLFYMNDVDHVTFRDLLIDGASTSTTDKPLIYLYGNENKYHFDNVTIKNFEDYGIKTSGTGSTLFVTGCTFKNVTYMPGSRAIYLYADNAFIENNVFDTVRGAVYSTSSGGLVVISGNYFYTCGDSTHRILYIDHDACKITKNHFEDCFYGIYLDGTAHVVRDNFGEIDNFGTNDNYALYLVNGNYSIIAGNNFEKYGHYVLRIKDSNYVTIRDNALAGLNLAGAVSSVICLENCDYPDIVNNITKYVDFYFVAADADSDYWRIYDNVTDAPNSIAVGSLPGALSVYSGFQAQRAAVDVKTDNYVILATDLGKTLVMNSADDKTFSLPSVGPNEDGAQISFLNVGAGRLTIDAADTDYVGDSGAGDGIYSDDTDAALTVHYFHTSTKWQIIQGFKTWVTYD